MNPRLRGDDGWGGGPLSGATLIPKVNADLGRMARAGSDRRLARYRRAGRCPGHHQATESLLPRLMIGVSPSHTASPLRRLVSVS